MHSEPRNPALWKPAALVALVAGAIAFTLLGSSPLAMSEAHRVLPAWDMLARGDALVTHLYDQPYLRKPPGLVWSIAAASWLMGQTEFSARSISALAFVLSCLLSLVFARRWWGHTAALPAGLAHAFTPLFWYPARSAEIESLHNLATQATLLLLLDVLLSPRERASWIRALLLGLGVTAMLAAKGPAGLPCIAGVAIACALRSSWRTLLRPALGLGLCLPVLATAVYLALLASRVAALDVPPVVQSPSTFLWAVDRLVGIAILIPAAIVSAMPVCLFLIPSLLPRAVTPGHAHASTLAWAVILSLAFYMLIGISNTRYAMPALVLLPALAGYAAAWWSTARSSPDASHQHLGKALLLDHPLIPAAVLLVLAGVYVGYSESRRTRISGKAEALRFAAALPPGEILLWADKLIEARPEFFLYAQREAASRGTTLRVRWVPQDQSAPTLPPTGTLLAIRTDSLTIRDDLEPEIETFARAGFTPESALLFQGRIHNFTFVVARVPTR